MSHQVALHVLCRYAQLVMERQRKRRLDDITSSTLKAMDRAMLAFMELFQRVIAPYMPSRGQTIKLHKSVHLADVCMRLGHPREFSAQFFEMEHAVVKRAYRMTSKKTTDDAFVEEMVSCPQAVIRVAFPKLELAVGRGARY
jgi:hypothetical protein